MKQFQYTDWSEDHCPTNSSIVIDLIGLMHKTQHQGGWGPVIIHDRSVGLLCYALMIRALHTHTYAHSSSVGRSGTFCTLSIVLEQVKLEGVLDIYFCIHSLRNQHAGIVANFVSSFFDLLVLLHAIWCVCYQWGGGVGRILSSLILIPVCIISLYSL